MTTAHRTLVVPTLVSKTLMDGVRLHGCPFLRCTDKGRKVNKQLKCQHLNVSEALTALPFALQQKRGFAPQLNLASEAFSPHSSVGRSSISSSEGALYRQLCHLSSCRHNNFHSMTICIIHNKCRFLFVLGQLWIWCFYVSIDMRFNYILHCAHCFSPSMSCYVYRGHFESRKGLLLLVFRNSMNR